MEAFKIVDSVNQCVTEKIQDWLMLEPESDQRKRIGYSIQTVLTEAEKLLFTLGIFSVFGYWWQVCIVMAVTLSLRIFMGGIHRKTTIGCMIQTSLTIGTTIILSEKFIVRGSMSYMVFLLVLLEIWKLVPIPSETRISYNEKQKLLFKLKAMTVLLILSILLSLASNRTGNIIWWSITMQFIEVLYAFLRQEEMRKRT